MRKKLILLNHTLQEHVIGFFAIGSTGTHMSAVVDTNREAMSVVSESGLKKSFPQTVE